MSGSNRLYTVGETFICAEIPQMCASRSDVRQNNTIGWLSRSLD